MTVPSIYARFEKHADKTFRDARERYLKELADDGKDTRRAELALDAAAPYIDHLHPIDVDDEVMQPYKLDRRMAAGPFKGRRPAMAGTINKELTQVTTVLNKACKVWRWIPSAPKLLHVSGQTRIPYPLSWDEQDRLFRFFPSGWDIGAAIFAVMTGVRKSELFGLKWADEVQIPELDTFVFVLRETKNGEQRAVICNSVARKLVEYQRGNGSEFVFPKERCNQSSKMWITAWLKAGLPADPLIRKGIHNCRHTCGHRLRAVEVPDEDRDGILGHNRKSLSQHYALPDIARYLAHAEKITVRRDTVVLR